MQLLASNEHLASLTKLGLTFQQPCYVLGMTFKPPLVLSHPSLQYAYTDMQARRCTCADVWVVSIISGLPNLYDWIYYFLIFVTSFLNACGCLACYIDWCTFSEECLLYRLSTWTQDVGYATHTWYGESPYNIISPRPWWFPLICMNRDTRVYGFPWSSGIARSRFSKSAKYQDQIGTISIIFKAQWECRGACRCKSGRTAKAGELGS